LTLAPAGAIFHHRLPGGLDADVNPDGVKNRIEGSIEQTAPL
jgi:hypothetical protein